MTVPVPPMFPVTVPPPVAFAPGITFNAKFPVPLLNVAEISVSPVIVNAQIVAVPVHSLRPHPPKTEPESGVSVKIIGVPLG
jgi:hypothetical protein